MTLAASYGSVDNLNASARHGWTPYSRQALAIATNLIPDDRLRVVQSIASQPISPVMVSGSPRRSPRHQLSRPIKPRADVVEILPSLRLATAVVIESHDEWKVTRRSLSAASMDELERSSQRNRPPQRFPINTKSPNFQYDSLIETCEPRQIRSPPIHETLSFRLPRAADPIAARRPTPNRYRKCGKISAERLGDISCGCTCMRHPPNRRRMATTGQGSAGNGGSR